MHFELHSVIFECTFDTFRANLNAVPTRFGQIWMHFRHDSGIFQCTLDFDSGNLEYTIDTNRESLNRANFKNNYRKLSTWFGQMWTNSLSNFATFRDSSLSRIWMYFLLGSFGIQCTVHLTRAFAHFNALLIRVGQIWRPVRQDSGKFERTVPRIEQVYTFDKILIDIISNFCNECLNQNFGSGWV